MDELFLPAADEYDEGRTRRYTCRSLPYVKTYGQGQSSHLNQVRLTIRFDLGSGWRCSGPLRKDVKGTSVFVLQRTSKRTPKRPRKNNRELAYLGVDVTSQKRHQKYRASNAPSMWGQDRHLSRLPPKSKQQVAVGQILAVGVRCREIQPPLGRARKTGSGDLKIGDWCLERENVAEMSEIEELEVAMGNKRVTSVYFRNLSDLRPIAEPIFREALGPDVELR